jgi:predicted DNA-binding WGR domain protein
VSLITSHQVVSHVLIVHRRRCITVFHPAYSSATTMALFDFTSPAAKRAHRLAPPPSSDHQATTRSRAQGSPQGVSQASHADAPTASPQVEQASERLTQLRLALDFALARQALTRKHLTLAQEKRDRGYQQSQFAQRAENRVQRQRAQRSNQDSHEALAQLQQQWVDQAQHITSLEERILAIQEQLAQAEGFTTAPPGSLPSAFMPASLMERFSGQIEL